jgi:CNT family concentrative nucleoside transporter
MPCGPRAPHPRNLELPTDEPLNLSQLHSLLGVFAFGLIAWMLSERRSVVAWRVVASGMLLQLALAALLLKVPGSQAFFVAINDAVAALDGATRTGTAFVFGFLGGAPLPYAETVPGASFVLAFRALPLVLVIGALSSLLYYWGVLQWIVRAFSWLLRKTMGVSGAIGLSSAANVFVGMVEAPMVVRPYLAAMSRSELFVVMTAGMASIAGTVFALYAVILGPVVPDAAGHLLAASLISAPAAITVAVLMLPDERAHAGESAELARSESTGTMDAITRGTQDAVGLLINIVAMLIVLVALVSLVNMLLGALLPQVGGAALSLQRIFGWVMAPVAWLVGIPWAEAAQAGALFGTKTVLNEFLAYLEMARLPAEALSPRSRLLLTYALCGFANFGSVGIMVGGLHAMVPERRRDIVVLATRSIVSGTLATCMTAAWVGALTP